MMTHSPKRFYSRLRWKTSRAPSQSCTEAAVTTTNKSKPRVSTNKWRLRALMYLAAAKPRTPSISVVLTLWLSKQLAVGCLWPQPVDAPQHEWGHAGTADCHS